MSDQRLSTELLERVGEVLYGYQWKTDLARDLGINPRSMRRFASGEMPISRRFAPELIRIIQRRRADLQSLMRELAQLVPPE
jgi:hypothetical protein